MSENSTTGQGCLKILIRRGIKLRRSCGAGGAAKIISTTGSIGWGFAGEWPENVNGWNLGITHECCEMFWWFNCNILFCISCCCSHCLHWLIAGMWKCIAMHWDVWLSDNCQIILSNQWCPVCGFFMHINVHHTCAWLGNIMRVIYRIGKFCTQFPLTHHHIIDRTSYPIRI